MRQQTKNRLLLLMLLSTLSIIQSVFAELKYEKLKDDVEHWYYETESKCEFVRMLENATNYIVSKKKKFGKSVALLTGVSDYRYLKPLSSVTNDLKKMKDFLLNNGGFDDVYIIQNKTLNRVILEHYMAEILPERIGPDGRILFYFSGHGDYRKGHSTGYMQFREASKDKLQRGNNTYPIKTLRDWCQDTDVKHILILLDCCASGAGIYLKGDNNCNESVFETLSGNGSRTILTACSSDEKAFALEGRDQNNQGVFTKAFLDGFSKSNNTGQCGFLTIDEIASEIKYDLAAFGYERNKKITPLFEYLNRDKYKGTFLFIHPKTKNIDLTPSQISAGGFIIKGKNKDRDADGIADSIDKCPDEPGEMKYDGCTEELQVPPQKYNDWDNDGIADHIDKCPKISGIKKYNGCPQPQGKAIDMIWVRKSRNENFQMGQPIPYFGGEENTNDEQPVHTVKVSGFWISKYEITQKEYEDVIGTNPSSIKEYNLPVDNVSWWDAIKYCNAKSNEEELEPCYYERSGACNFLADGYRLPTEAEWEYAARGGRKSKNYLYSGNDTLDEVGWYNENSKNIIHPVGIKNANELGIYDMSGNVWEWCNDWYRAKYYQSSPELNPKGSNNGEGRVIRGGSCSEDAQYIRSANRGRSKPSDSDKNHGFRVVRSQK